MDDLNIQETIMPSPLKKAFPLKLVIGIGVGVCGVATLAVGGYFAYQNFFLSPEEILLRMVQKQKEIKTFRSDMEIRAELNGVTEMISGFSGGLLGLPQTQGKEEVKKPTVFIMKSVGAFDEAKDRFFPDSSVSFNLAVDESGKQPELEGKNIPQQTVLLGAEMRTKDKVGYIALKKTPNLGFMNFSALENQWMKFDTQSDESKKQVDEVTKQIEEVFPKEKQKELADAFLKKKPFKIKKGNEKIPGVPTHHLIIEVGRTEVKALLELINSVVPQDKKTSEEELKKAEESFAQFIPADKPLQFNLWVGKRDFYVYQFRFGFDIPKLPDTSVSGNIVMRITVKDINKPVSIEVPKDVKKMEEVFGTLFGSPSTGPKDSDGDGLSDTDEIYYGSDQNNPDTDGDSYKDGDEVKNGYDPRGSGKLTLPPPPSSLLPQTSPIQYY